MLHFMVEDLHGVSHSQMPVSNKRSACYQMQGDGLMTMFRYPHVIMTSGFPVLLA
jgi:hypothetical protein